jgi:prepilin-type N-terminal cleavage/methylation domain-containing protein
MNFAHPIRREDGMTLFEVLVVLLILGALAAVSLAIFSGQDQSALDTQAKSNARNLLWKVQTCFTAREDYTLCDEPTEQEPPPGVIWGDGIGEAEVVQGPETTRYRLTVRAVSLAKSGGSNHTFTIIKEVGGKEERTCLTDGGDNNAGGCREGVW